MVDGEVSACVCARVAGAGVLGRVSERAGLVCDGSSVRAGPEAAAGGGGGGGGEKDALFVELWKACAGPVSSIPPLGEKVYYFPQGHIEQVRPPSRRTRSLSLVWVLTLSFPRVFFLCCARARVHVSDFLAEFRGGVLHDRCELRGLGRVLGAGFA